MIQLADDGELSDRDQALTEPGATRLFHDAVKAMRWHPIDDDGRENLAFGVLETATRGHTAMLTLGSTGTVSTLRLTVRLGRIRRDLIPALLALWKLQAASQAARFVPDMDEGDVRLEATAFLSDTCDPAPVVQAVVNDVRAILEDDRLLAIVSPEPVRQAS